MARIGCTDFQETKTGGKEREPALGVPLRFIPAHCKFLDTRDDTTVTTIRELAAVLVSTFWRGGGGEGGEGRGIPGNRRATWKLFFLEFFLRPTTTFINNTPMDSYRVVSGNRGGGRSRKNYLRRN